MFLVKTGNAMNEKMKKKINELSNVGQVNMNHFMQIFDSSIW